MIAIVEALRRRGYTPGVVSRGFGGSATAPLEVSRAVDAAQCGDEPLLMRVRTGAPVVVARDRVAAARHLLWLHPAVDIVVSDDGLQHLALARDVEILVFDERGVGNGWLLPAGPLREPLPREVPARALVLYNAAAASTPLPGSFARRSLAGAVSLQAWWGGERASLATLDSLRERPLVAAAGLARPQRFFEMLRGHELSINPLALPDHYRFTALPWPVGTADVIVTEKDAVKLDPDCVGATRVWVAPLDFGLDAAFVTALIARLPAPGSAHGN